MKTHKILLLILIFSLSSGSFAQNSGKKYFITGQVLDANDKPVPGVSMMVDNKSTNVVTDAKGNYKVKVKPEASVVSAFSLFSGLLISEEIKGRVVIDFKFADPISQKNVAQKVNTENEDVNIGFGTVQKKDLPSNIATVDRKKNKYESYQNIYDLIRAELSNVKVVGDKIILKGAYDSNTGPYDALILVDGVESSLSSVLPRMVKSISVLTGADASIYGAKSAHGVLLITLTKE